MAADPYSLRLLAFTRRRAVIALVWLILGGLFAFLTHTARQSVLNEVRAHAMDVAAAVACGMRAEDLDVIHGEADLARPEYARVQHYLANVTATLPDIRYAYTMRRDPRAGAAPTDFQYLVDGPPKDANGNGRIEPDERSEAPGAPYDASDFPAMVQALDHPTADADIQPDPPYPDLMSGYAPIRDASERAVALVGVDITAATVRAKLIGVYAVNLGCYLLLCLLLAVAGELHARQRRTLEHVQHLSRELTTRNDLLTAANKELSRRHSQMQEELKLAQQVQLGFLPRDFPRRDRLNFDRVYITSDVLGGDLFDVFTIDRDRVGLYMADVAGHGVSAALISGLLKMAVTSLREKSAGFASDGEPEAAQPGLILSLLNDMLIKEIPDSEFITMIYAVVDLRVNAITVACAGHPPPFVMSRKSGDVGAWTEPHGMALGMMAGQTYRDERRSMAQGDCIVFYTDGLIEAMNTTNEEFGESPALEVLRRHAGQPPAGLLQALRLAVDTHRDGAAVSDDFSLLVCEFT